MASPTYRIARALAGAGVAAFAATCLVRAQVPAPRVRVEVEGGMYVLSVHNEGGDMQLTDVRFVQNNYVNAEFAYGFIGQNNGERWRGRKMVWRNTSLTLVALVPWEKATRQKVAASLQDVCVRLDYAYAYVPVLGYVLRATKDVEIYM
jgi:hypothetical protein